MATTFENDSILDEINEYIQEDDMVLSMRLNCPDDTRCEQGFEFLSCIKFDLIALYFIEKYNANIKASSVGIHYNGKRHIRHIHFNVISDTYKKTSNPTSDRKTFTKQHGEFFPAIYANWKVETKFQSVKENRSKYAPLTYPLKEGHVINQCMTWKGEKMSFDMINWLQHVGNKIYTEAQALQERKELAEERKKQRLLNLGSFCELHADEYNDLQSMRRYLDDHFIKHLKLEDRPCPINFLRECKQVASVLGIWRYSDQQG